MNDAYGQTDVMHDPNYLRSLLAHNNPRVRAQGEEGLRQLQAQEVHQQQLAEFQQREMDRNRAHDENLGLRQSEADSRGVQREAMAGDKEKAGEDRRAAMLHTILNDPTADPDMKKAIQGHLLKQAGVSYTPTVDPKVAALARSKGIQAPTPQTVGGAPQGTAPVTSPGTGVSAPFGQPAVQRNVDAGHVVGPLASTIPAGKDLNFNTGELVDKNHEGTINGQPASRALGEGALRTGISPESPAGIRGLAEATQNRALSMNNPAPNENMTANPVTPTWSPTQLVGQPQTAPSVAPTGPPSNPTPAPGTQFQGPVTAAASFVGQPNAPVAQPALTPPALPPVKRPTPDEERQRMLANQ